MQKVTIARTQLGPLLDQLISELEQEGSATQKAYFNRIRGRLYQANDEWELTGPIRELASSPAIGFQLSHTAHALMSRILHKTAELVAELEGVEPTVH